MYIYTYVSNNYTEYLKQCYMLTKCQKTGGVEEGRMKERKGE